MMLRSLVDEVVRRRMWPIPLVAILIAVAAPLLFMKSAPDSASSTAPPPPAPAGKLPGVAGQLVSTSDKAAAAHKRSKRKGQDPFAPPASAKSATTAPAAQRTPSAGGSTVVVKNSDGSTATLSVPKATASASAPNTKATATKPATTPKVATPDPTTSSAAAKLAATSVDVRFGERMGTRTRQRVPRLQTFRAGGKVAAMFVHYSAEHDKAVFAIAPSTTVGGDVGCRKVQGVCRYVDIPAGSYARLTLRAEDGSYISRRLDVVQIRHLGGTPEQSQRANTLTAATCLLKSLLKLPVSVPSISSDACE
jgi:hypothetical protein